MIFQDMPENQARKLRLTSASAPMSDPAVDYPDWYMHRWHFLPEGYLSERSAAGYDRVIRNVYNVFNERRIARALLRKVRTFAPESVLEVGPGPGRLLERLAGLRSVSRLTGVELSPYLLARAAERLQGRQVELVHGDGLAMPVPDGEFALATASHYLGHLPPGQRSRAVDELARVVRPGGHVLIVDHRWHAWPKTPLLRKVESTTHAFGSIRMSVFERLHGGVGP